MNKKESLYEVILIHHLPGNFIYESDFIINYNEYYEREKQIWDIWYLMLSFEEFDFPFASNLINLQYCVTLCENIKKVVDMISEKIKSDNFTNSFIQNRINLLHWMYLNKVDIRIELKKLLISMVLYHSNHSTHTRQLDGGNSRCHVNYLLELFLSIIKGYQLPLSIENKSILVNVFLPLYLPNEMIEWRDQIPLLQVYHNNLLNCCITLICNERNELNYSPNQFSLFYIFFHGLLQAWPIAKEANTGKELLIIDSLESLFNILSISEASLVLETWIDKWVYYIGSDFINYRTKQRALLLFRNEKILELFHCNILLDRMLPALYKGGELSWNPTVNKMIALALEKLEKAFEDIFYDKFDQMVSSKSPGRFHQSQINDPFASSIGSITTVMPNSASQATRRLDIRPPIGTRSSTSMLPPTSRVMLDDTCTKPLRSIQTLSKLPKVGISSTSSMTITGVAPWAVNQTQRAPISEGKEQSASTNREVFLSFIERCKPSNKTNDSIITSDWKAQQAAAIPTLLPNLKFHDLVFGKELGKGSFSIVKYARVIVREHTREYWPEYAVKIISESSLQQYQYHTSVIREIAILQQLEHPGIARLISAFRYHKSSYMVLEYAALGDLHSYIIRYGKLSHLYVRYIIGEVASALHSIHQIGFTCNDLKPENILITEIGHLKLTDFGAARPMTDEKKDNIIESCRLLGILRNGDWKLVDQSHIAASIIDENLEDSIQRFLDDDIRIEGTPAYADPLLLESKTKPSILTDAWSLGCVAVFCLQGKPKYFGNKEEVLQQVMEDFKVTSKSTEVKFSNEVMESDIYDDILYLSKKDSISSVDIRAKRFLQGLICYDHSKRMTIEDVLNHEYLTIGELDPTIDIDDETIVQPHLFHENPPLILPKPLELVRSDAEPWARRQFSILWSPMSTDIANAVTSPVSSEY